MEYTYQTEGTCSKVITFTLTGNVVTNVHFVGGCPGNTVGVSKLVQNRNVDEVIKLLKGIQCGDKGTSCPDQVAKALENYKKIDNNKE